MVAKESYFEEHEAGNEKSIDLLQDPFESEETLSLCDLPVHSDSAQWDDFSKEDGQSSTSNNNDDEEDLFEFFNEDFTSSTRGNTEKTIIFCGKIIPYKEPSKYLIPQKEKNYESNCKKGVVPSSKSTVKAYDSGSMKGQRVKGSKDLMCRYKVEEVSLLRSRTKSRWYLFTFGMSRLPTQMELKDIRRRQSRQGPTDMSPVPEDRKAIKNKERRNGKGLLRIWSSLGFGCTSRNANDAVDMFTWHVPMRQSSVTILKSTLQQDKAGFEL